MVHETLGPDTTLPEMLAARARAASTRRLTADVVGGLLVAAASMFWRPSWWPLSVSAALCFAAFGVWGIADREARADPTAATRALCAVAAVVGTLSAIALVLGVVGFAVGPFKL